MENDFLKSFVLKVSREQEQKKETEKRKQYFRELEKKRRAEKEKCEPSFTSCFRAIYRKGI